MVPLQISRSRIPCNYWPVPQPCVYSWNFIQNVNTKLISPCRCLYLKWHSDITCLWATTWSSVFNNEHLQLSLLIHFSFSKYAIKFVYGHNKQKAGKTLIWEENDDDRFQSYTTPLFVPLQNWVRWENFNIVNSVMSFLDFRITKEFGLWYDFYHIAFGYLS